MAAGRRLETTPDGNNAPVVIIGPELEENLSTRYLTAALAGAGIGSAHVAFNGADDAARVIADTVAIGPRLIGMSVPFQAHARASLDLATALRARGLESHITLGGHFATFEYENVLRDYPAVDSVVRHEGEHALVELYRRLIDGAPLAGMAGLVARTGNGVEVGPLRRLPPLDELPFPHRSASPHCFLGIASASMAASRGCYGDCSFCCIHAYSRAADGPRYRQRSVENVAAEMEHEHRTRGARLFIFHDDNFFVPNRSANLDRYRRLAQCLEQRNLGRIALVIKCRPTDVDPELFALLKQMGLIRAYVGIESNSAEGLVSLNRRATQDDNRGALAVLGELDIFHSFNILLFDPEATLDGVRANLDFIERFAESPSNFCRAEVYAGTALKRALEEHGRLRGDYMAWDYVMRDPRVEVLFRIAVVAFAGRNFKCDGVANLNMGIRSDAEIMRFFHRERFSRALHDDLVELSVDIANDTAGAMRDALDFVNRVDVHDNGVIKPFAIELARRVASSDLRFIARIKRSRRQMEGMLAEPASSAREGPQP